MYSVRIVSTRTRIIRLELYLYQVRRFDRRIEKLLRARRVKTRPD